MNTQRYVEYGLVSQEQHDSYLESLKQHIAYVQEAGRKLGLPDEVIADHDASKFEMIEFVGYARKFGKGPPPAINDTPVEVEFSRSWLHHIHANDHHWQHWIFPDGYSPAGSGVEAGCVKMHHYAALHMIADWEGASKLYTGSWDMTNWLAKNMPKIRLHSETGDFVRGTLDMLSYADVVNCTAWAHEGA